MWWRWSAHFFSMTFIVEPPDLFMWLKTQHLLTVQDEESGVQPRVKRQGQREEREPMRNETEILPAKYVPLFTPLPYLMGKTTYSLINVVEYAV